MACYRKTWQLNQVDQYDVGIIGGGLAGLALSILLSKAGHSVILYEKERYPFHKVCGEYISMESWDFLSRLGIDLKTKGLPIIKKLEVSTTKGVLLKHDLSLGGFGISRYTLDHELAMLAKAHGVIVEEGTKVNEVEYDGDNFSLLTTQTIKTRVVAGCFGKRSNIDIRKKRKFTTLPKNKLNNFIGVKYHVHTEMPDDLIGLHLFPGGYCGVVRVDEGKTNLCYLTTAENLVRAENSISQMEKKILMTNPRLEKIFQNISVLPGFPLTISQVSFDSKSQVEDHMLMVGDAAGMITPLCGNGMSMALHGSKLAAEAISSFLKNKIDRQAMEKNFTNAWRQQFNTRLSMGRAIQKVFYNRWVSEVFVRTGKAFPAFTGLLEKSTHGKPF